MIQRMDKNNSLVKLMKKFQKGARPAFHMGPFLPLVRIKERGLSFNDVMRDATAMTEAALMSFEFGFESTVLPFDMNVEAEMLGAQVRYHDGFDGNPVYPTIATKPFTHEGDIKILDALPEKGRIPAILKSIGAIKEQAEGRGAVGVFIAGPFTLAGQVMDMDALYKMILKQPEKTLDFFEQLSTFINQIINLYIDAGADFMIIVEGGGQLHRTENFSKILITFFTGHSKVPKHTQNSLFLREIHGYY
jgi:uroporphyrinogen-III decarboxylase